MASKETLLRTSVKTIGWRVINLIADFSIAYFLTGKLVVAASFSVISFFVTMGIYFLHERAWNSIKWGRN